MRNVGVQINEERGVGGVSARRDLGWIVLEGDHTRDFRQRRQRRQHPSRFSTNAWSLNRSSSW